MKRLDFIRKSILAAAGLTVLPAVVAKEFSQEPIATVYDVIDAAKRQVETSGYQAYFAQFKINNQLLYNKYMMNEEINEACKHIGDQYKLHTVEIGHDYDDFSKDLLTVRLKFI